MSVSPPALAYASRKAVSPLVLFRLNIYWLGLSLLWGGFAIVYLPDRVEALVGPEIKGTMLGLITVVGVSSAVLVQGPWPGGSPTAPGRAGGGAGRCSWAARC